MTTVSGNATSAATNLTNNPCAINGKGPLYAGALSTARTNVFGLGAAANRFIITTTAANLRANTVLNSIEAELRVQGDPSDWLCSPVKGYARNLAILVMNTFFLNADPNGGDCPVWSNVLQQLNKQNNLYNTTCNEILSNRNWFITGAEHQIREGSYTTSIKVALYTPGVEASAGQPPASTPEPVLLGGDPIGGTFVCQQGTFTCNTFVPEGAEDVNDGTSWSCDTACGSDLYVS
jgi:hypothetical protein